MFAASTGLFQGIAPILESTNHDVLGFTPISETLSNTPMRQYRGRSRANLHSSFNPTYRLSHILVNF